MPVSWFYVKCAECAKRYGVDIAPKLFRADISQWGEARVQVRTKSGWASLLVRDNDKMAYPVVNCAHNHRFEDLSRGTGFDLLVTQIQRAIERAHAVGAAVGLIEPSDRVRPGQARAAMAEDLRSAMPDAYDPDDYPVPSWKANEAS